MRSQGLPLVALALLAWLPVFLQDLLGEFPPSLVASSPVLLRAALLAALVCAAIAAAIAGVATLFTRLARRRLAAHAFGGGAAAVLLASAGVLQLRVPYQRSAFASALPAESSLAALVLIASLLAAALLLPLLLAPALVRTALLPAAALAGLACWAGSLLTRFPTGGWTLFVFGSNLAGIALLLGWRLFAPGAQRARAPLWLGVAALGLVAP
ncbi:MAG: hypothetical protein V3U03_02125, partial [Myxococcota bacterium]